MKIFILTMIATFGFGGVFMTSAKQKPDELVICAGDNKTSKASKLKVEFVSVIEDSRCPPDVNCIWAGNAKIKVNVTDSRGRSKMVEMNTTLGPKGDQFAGYAINLTNLTAKETDKPGDTNYRATFSIEKLTR